VGTVSAARTDWESITAAVGSGLRPATALTWSRSTSCSRASVPSSRQPAKYPYTVCRGDLLFDLLSLGLVFLALRCQPGFGPLAVAYAAANIASAIPLTPGRLGVIEVTMVAITVGFGAPRATAVLAVLGYRS